MIFNKIVYINADGDCTKEVYYFLFIRFYTITYRREAIKSTQQIGFK